ncbi:predicted protein [Postia placenta Mad-698-R]|nr:predicted protein [Postia placenta Mad-698-R]
MTVFLPLEASSPFPQTPSFLVPSSDPSAHVKRVVKAIMKARRIAVVCGAGISVQAGIPDFRSSDGLFQSLKKDNPALSSGRDLFDASVFNSETTTSMFCQMMAQLYELSEVAVPTAFHKLLRALDDRGRLLRVYTQNIDALEQKSGLTFGVPETMSSTSASTSKPQETSSKPSESKDENAPPTLGLLEEDDEFEEFAVADWDDSETNLAHLGGAAPGAAKSGGDKLWEDNWDDDDIEDDFSVQLRNELAKKSKSSGGPEPMQH